MKAKLTLIYKTEVNDSIKKQLQMIHDDWKRETDYHERIKLCDALEVNFETFYIGPIDIKLEFEDDNDSEPKCFNCKYFMPIYLNGPLNTELKKSEKGRCRKNPPVLKTNNDRQGGTWPMVYIAEWCGSWEPK